MKEGSAISAPAGVLLPPRSLAARWRRVTGVLLRGLLPLRRDPAHVSDLLFWPSVEILVWGYVSLFLRTFEISVVVAALLGGVLLWQVLSRCSFQVSLAFLQDVWGRNLLNVFVSPLTTAEYLTGLVLLGLFNAGLGVAVATVLAAVLYGFGVFSLGLALVPFLAVLLVMGWVLAIVALAAVLRFGQGAAVVSWTLAFGVQPFAAVFYPVSILPEPLRAVAAAVPASHVFEGMRAVLAGQPIPWADLGVAALLDAGYLAVALFVFSRTLRYVRAKGRLSRFAS